MQRDRAAKAAAAERAAPQRHDTWLFEGVVVKVRRRGVGGGAGPCGPWG
jgi:hypothetical protein